MRREAPVIHDAVIKNIFQQYKTIAVYGLSTNREKSSHSVPVFLSGKGYAIIPVHPSAENIDNLKAYACLRDIPVRIDVLEVFRPSAQVPDVVREALQRRAERGDIAVIRLQDG
jgi:uncharacterized protein